MFPVESGNLHQLEEIVFTNSQMRERYGQVLHDPEEFQYQRQLWNTVLAQTDPSLAKRIRHLLPETAVTDINVAHFYREYDCGGFAFYVACPDRVEKVTDYKISGNIIRVPEIRYPEEMLKPFWQSSDLAPSGFQQVTEPLGRNPTFVVLTSDANDPVFCFVQPFHFAVYLGCFDGTHYVAQKVNTKYLPEILPLNLVIQASQMESGLINPTIGVEFWEYTGQQQS